MQQLTPLQNANTQKNIQSLLESRANSVKVPITKGTFHNTENGWVNTSTGQWKANPKLENYPIFSVKWGPARHAFTEQGETEQNIKGKSHLYMFFGVDRLVSRDFPTMDDRSHVNNMFSMSGIPVTHIFFSDTSWNPNDITKIAVALTPEMFEVNWRLDSNASTTDLGSIIPPDLYSQYYTGWVETPWSSYSKYEMTATYWACFDGINYGIALVLYRGPYVSLPFVGIAIRSLMVESLTEEGVLGEHTVSLTEPISEVYTVFDEVPSPSLSSTSVAIAQGLTGGLLIEETICFPPALAVRGHLYAYYGASIYCTLVPALVMPDEGLIQAQHGNYLYFSCKNLRYKGSYVWIKGVQLSQSDIFNINAGTFNWQNHLSEQNCMLAMCTNVLRHNEYRVYMPSLAVMNPVGAYAAEDLNLLMKFNIDARVYFDKQLGIYVLQFWNDYYLQEPLLPSNCVDASQWFNWGCLMKHDMKNADGKPVNKSLLFRPKDAVVGTLDYSDTSPDSWYALSAYPVGRWSSLEHTTKLSTEGEGIFTTKALQLFKFNDLEYHKHELDDTDHYLVRHPTEDGGAVLQYAPLSSQYPPVDTDLELSVDLNSIQYNEELSDSTYLQLYKFPDNERLDVSAVLSDTTDVVLRHRYLSADAPVVEVDYLSADEVVNPVCDTDATYTGGYSKAAYKSLDEGGKDVDTGKKIWELYKFKDRSYQTHLSDLVDGCAKFVIREESSEDGSTRVNYVPAEELKIKVDTDGDESKSIEKYGPYNSELRLYNFLSAADTFRTRVQEPTFKDMSDYDLDFLVRDSSSNELKYYNLKYLSRYGDADVPGLNMHSIETCSDLNSLDSPYYLLNDFKSPTINPVNFTLQYDDKAYHMTNGLTATEDVQFVIRNGLGNSKDVQYYDFTITAPKVGMSALTQEVINELTSSHCDCGEKWVYISAVIDDLSSLISDLSGNYWEQGGDSSTCYGSLIGDSGKSPVIDLDNKQLAGSWSVNTLEIDTYFKVDGTIDFYPNGCAYFTATPYFQNGAVSNTSLLIVGGGCLVIGSTALSESQLQQLLRLL